MKTIEEFTQELEFKYDRTTPEVVQEAIYDDKYEVCINIHCNNDNELYMISAYKTKYYIEVFQEPRFIGTLEKCIEHLYNRIFIKKNLSE